MYIRGCLKYGTKLASLRPLVHHPQLTLASGVIMDASRRWAVSGNSNLYLSNLLGHRYISFRLSTRGQRLSAEKATSPHPPTAGSFRPVDLPVRWKQSAITLLQIVKLTVSLIT